MYISFNRTKIIQSVFLGTNMKEKQIVYPLQEYIWYSTQVRYTVGINSRLSWHHKNNIEQKKKCFSSSIIPLWSRSTKIASPVLRPIMFFIRCYPLETKATTMSSAHYSWANDILSILILRVYEGVRREGRSSRDEGWNMVSRSDNITSWNTQ